MSGHTTIPKISRLEVVETGSRRRWTPEEKLRIIAESIAVPRNVSATARRYGLSNGQLFTWRRLARAGKLVVEADEAGFVPAVVTAGRPMAAEASSELRTVPAPPHPDGKARAAGQMEIVLSGTRRVIVGSDVEAAALLRVIDVLERR
jgi:transposase